MSQNDLVLSHSALAASTPSLTQSKGTRAWIHEDEERPAVNGQGEFGEVEEMGGRHPTPRHGPSVRLAYSGPKMTVFLPALQEN